MSNFNLSQVWRNSTDSDLSVVSTVVETSAATAPGNIGHGGASNGKYIQINPETGLPIVQNNNNQNEISSQSSYLYQRLIHEAPNSEIVNLKSESTDDQFLPEWIDAEKLRHGRQFIQRHFFAIIFAHAVGIMLLVTVKPIQSLLLRTSSRIHFKSDKAFTFFLKIFLQLIQWYKNIKYEFLAVDNTSSSKVEKELGENPGNVRMEVDLNDLRNLIKSINEKFKKLIPPLRNELLLTDKEQVMLKCLQNDLQNCGVEQQDLVMRSEAIRVTMNPKLPFSQYHLVVVQYTFYGLISKYPKLFGIYEEDNGKGAEGFKHIWAVLGYLLGISDEFNCALLSLKSQSVDSFCEVAEIRSYEDSILKNILLYSFCIVDETGFHLWRIISSGFTKYFLCLRTDMIVQFILQNMISTNSPSPSNPVPVPQKTFWSNMRLSHKLYYLFYSLILNCLLKCCLFRVILNQATKTMIRFANFFYRRSKKLSLENAKSNSSFTLTRSMSSISTEVTEVV